MHDFSYLQQLTRLHELVVVYLAKKCLKNHCVLLSTYPTLLPSTYPYLGYELGDGTARRAGVLVRGELKAGAVPGLG